MLALLIAVLVIIGIVVPIIVITAVYHESFLDDAVRHAKRLTGRE